ncbi:hypothetical protein cyc_08428 [Cyclospora cayetanensis]|uniref:Uncharacterized protein n=1 Tax=Cyclospora cayetanensis TaxID=88456 RepID=A0A1D3DA84_9EIME|nr:hypothetical protein cyc_08428 [Cyclospora cayetanensis]
MPQQELLSGRLPFLRCLRYPCTGHQSPMYFTKSLQHFYHHRVVRWPRLNGVKHYHVEDYLQRLRIDHLGECFGSGDRAGILPLSCTQFVSLGRYGA